MSKKEQLEKKITDLKKGLASAEKVGSLPANVKQNLEKLLSESEKELAELEKEPKKEEPKKEVKKEPKIKSKVASIKKAIKKEPQEKKEKPKSALERCKELLSRYKKQKKTSSVRAEKRRKAGKPATLTPSEAVSKTAKSVKVKVVSIKEKTDAGLSKGEINKMVSGIVSTIKATLDGIVTSADKNEFLREIQAEIRDLRTDMPKVAEMGGSVDFNEGAGMFVNGGGVETQTEISAKKWVDNLVKEYGYDEAYQRMKYNVSGKNPYFRESPFWVTYAWQRFNELDPNKYAEGGATDFVNEGAGMFANGGKLTDEQILSKTIVYDNNGETFDRYTIFTPDGSVYGMSENATGFNQYLGEKDEIRKGTHLGKKLSNVPDAIKWAVLQRMKYEQGGITDFVNEGAGMFAKGGEVWDKAEQLAQQDIDDWRDTQIAAYLGIDDEDVNDTQRRKAVSKRTLEYIEELTNKYAKGGLFGSREYKRGLAYKLDRAKYNKSEKWEKPLNERKRYDEGGEMDEMKPKLSDDVLMLLSQVKQIKHHADEILQMIDSDGHIDSWVIAKAERSATDISDIYHYLDGRRDIFCCGGTLEYGGAIVDQSYGLLSDPRFDVQSPVFEEGGNTNKYPEWLFVGVYPNAYVYADTRTPNYDELGRIYFKPELKIKIEKDINLSKNDLELFTRIINQDYKETVDKVKKDGYLTISATGQKVYFNKEQYAEGGNILAEDTVARVDDPSFADVGQYAKGGEIDKELIDASAKNIYEKQGMMALRNIFLQTAQADENSGNKELADYRRMVVSQYQSKQPKYMAKGGKTGSDILKTYKRNEDRNLHSENVVLLAKNFGTKEDLAKAKEILKKHDDLGYLSSELDEERSALHKKLYPKLVEMNFDILNFED